MIRVVAAMALVLLVAACGGGSTQPSDITGTYTLRTANGAALPYTIQQDSSGTIEILDDAITIVADGTYSESGHVRLTPAAGAVSTMTVTDGGTYSRRDVVLRLSSSQSGTSTAIIDGTSLRIATASNVEFVYQR